MEIPDQAGLGGHHQAVLVLGWCWVVTVLDLRGDLTVFGGDP